MKSISGVLFSLGCSAVLFIFPCRAVTISWTNSSGGNWSVASNWSPNQVPGPSDSAVITASGTYTVAFDTSATIAGFTLGDSNGTQTFSLGGNALTLNGLATVNRNGVFNLSGGSLGGNGVIAGLVTWTGGAFAAGSTLTIATNGVLVLAGVDGADYALQGALTNAGTIRLESGNLGLVLGGCTPPNGELINLPGALLDLAGDVSVNNDNSCGGGSVLMVNEGTVLKSGGTGTSTISAPLSNSGLVDAETGTININGSGGATTFGGDFLGAGTNLVSGGTFTLNGLVTSSNLVLAGGNLAGSGVIAGLVTWTGGGFAAGSTLTIATNGVLVLAGVNGADYALQGALTNAGTIRLESGNLGLVLGGCTPPNGELINLPGALLDLAGDVSVNNDNSCGGGSVLMVNEGTVLKSGGTGNSTISAPLSNSGVVDAETGTININGSGGATTFGGDFLGAGTNLVSGGTFTLNGLVTSSNLVLAGGNLAGSAVIAGLVTWTGGAFAAGSTLTIATNGVLVLAGTNGTDYALQGVLTNAGTIRLESGNLGLVLGGCTAPNGELINLPGALLDLAGDVSVNNDNSCGGGSVLMVNEGTVLKSGGTGTSTISAPLSNSGVVDAETGTININGSGGATTFGGDFLGAGTNLVSGGTFTLNGLVTSSNLVLAGGNLAGSAVIAGLVTWTGGEFAAGSTLTIATNGVLVLAGTNGTDYAVQGVLTNAGTIRLESGNLGLVLGGCTAPNGELINLPGALLDLAGDVSVNDDNSCGGGSVLMVNEGTVRKSDGTGTSIISTSFSNFGTLDAQTGTVSVTGPYSLAVGTLNFGISSLTNFGTVNLAGNAGLTGTLSANLNNGFVPDLHDAFQVLTYGSFSGNFTSTNLPPVAVWQTINAATATTISVLQLVPTITWTSPANIVYGTPLSGAQLDATAASPANPGIPLTGTFTYNPPLGTVLYVSSDQILSVTFTPTDTTDFTPASTNVSINVLQAPLTVSSGLTANSKVYDRTTTAILTSNNVVLTGIIAGDTVSLNTNGYVATFASAGVGNNIAVTASGLSLSGASATNYFLSPPDLLADVTPAGVTVASGLTANSKIYDRTTTAIVTSNNVVLTGIIAGDTVSLNTNGYVATFASAGVGNNIAVTASSLTLRGIGATNYSLTQPSLSANITPAGVAINSGLTANNKVYDRSTTATLSSNIVVLAGVIAGDTVSLNTNGYLANFANAGVGNSIAVVVSGLTLRGTGATNYSFTQPSLSANITPAGVASTSGLTANSKVYDRSTTATLSSNNVTLVGIVTGDTVNLNTNGYIADFAGAGVGDNIAVTVSGLTLSGAGATNYSLTQPSLSANIMPAGVTLASGLTANSKIYDRSTTAILSSNNVVLSGIIAGDTVSLNTNGYIGSFASARVGNNIPVTVSGLSLNGAGATNYSLSQPSLLANITPAGVTIASGLAAEDKIYDRRTTAILSSNNVVLTGIIAGDTVSLNTNGYVANFASAGVGDNIAVVVSGLSLSEASSTNYSLTQPSLSANIEAPSVSIVAHGPNIVISWTTNAAVFVLAQATNLIPASTWSSITNNITVSGTNNTLKVDVTGRGQQYFRLVAEP